MSTDQTKSRPILRKLLLSLSVAIFCSFTVMFFSPMDIVIGNINQFSFTPGEVIPILLVFCLAATAVMTVVGTLLPFKASLILNSIEFAAGLCCYVQSFFLNGKMGSLTGEADNYGRFTKAANIAVWAFILVAVTVAAVLLIKFKKENIFRGAAVFLALSLSVMQLTAFLTSVFSVKTSSRETSYYLSDIGEFEVASKENTVMFIVDTCDGRFIDRTKNQFPDLFDGLDGFVYYPNATSTHSRTYPSLPYLLTGKICHFDKPYSEYVNEAFDGSTYVQDIKATDCNVGIYTNDQYIGESGMPSIDNKADNLELYVSKYGTVKQMAKMSLYRVMPYAFKARFVYDSAPVNADVLRIPESHPNKCITSDDMTFYSRLINDGLAVGNYDKAFRLYHMWGAHPGAKFDENMQPIEAASTEQSVRGDFLIIQKYIEQMKKLGVYEKSTIIITADHGSSRSCSVDDSLEIDSPPTVAMLVKPAGCGMSGEGVSVSDAPVCHDDLFSTIIDSLGGSYEKYGVPVWDHVEGEQRTRYYYYQALYSDIDGEVALREYSIDGDARDFSNWKLTGNNWDILYSERAVSKHRLSDIK